MLIGYARVSTDDQNLDLQRDALRLAGCEKIYEDRMSGAKAARPGLTLALEVARAGDVLTVWRLDRLGRSLHDLILLGRKLDELGIGLMSVQEKIDTSSSGGRLVFHMFGALANKRERRVVDLAAAFLGEESPDIAYTHPGMCLTVLPHRATVPDEVWSRSNANASLEVHPLRDSQGVYHGVPYGPKARLMLLFLQSEAPKTCSRFVELGRSMRQWLLSMGVRDCGTNYKVVADQAERIENCVLRFRYQGREGESRWQDSIVRGSFRPFAEDGIAVVELSEGFYDALTRHPVPICESAIRLLVDTCMPLDIYLWLAYRLHSLEQPKTLSWGALHLQFGAGTRLLKHFKPRFARDLELAMAVYPDAAVELTEEGVRLRPSPPPVPPKLRAVANSRISPSDS